MLRTVLDLEGDCFEERWAQVERRVRRHCEAAELHYPVETLQAIRPWFATVGDWFDWAGILLQGPILTPSDVDPVLRVVREAEQLRVFFEDENPDHHPEFSEGYEYFSSTIRWANLAFLRVVQDGQRGDPQYHPRLRDSAILALAEYVDSTGQLIYGSRKGRVESALKERARQTGKDTETIRRETVATAVQEAIQHLYETVEVRPNPLDRESYLNRLSVGREVLLDRLVSVPKPPDGGESITVLGRYPTFSPQMEPLLKASKASSILMRNLLPGVDPSELRYAAERVITEDLFGPDARTVLRSDEPDPLESLHAPVAEDAESGGGSILLDLEGKDDANFGRFEAQHTLRRLIDRADLTDGELQAFVHRELHGVSVEETAKQMDSTKGSVSALLSRAKSKLKDAAEPGNLP